MYWGLVSFCWHTVLCPEILQRCSIGVLYTSPISRDNSTTGSQWLQARRASFCALVAFSVCSILANHGCNMTHTRGHTRGPALQPWPQRLHLDIMLGPWRRHSRNSWVSLCLCAFWSKFPSLYTCQCPLCVLMLSSLGPASDVCPDAMRGK